MYFHSVAIVSELLSSGHFLDVMFKFPNCWPRYFGILHITFSINGGRQRACEIEHLCMIQGSSPEGFLAFSDKRVTEILGEAVCLTTLGEAIVDIISHEPD